MSSYLRCAIISVQDCSSVKTLSRYHLGLDRRIRNHFHNLPFCGEYHSIPYSFLGQFVTDFPTVKISCRLNIEINKIIFCTMILNGRYSHINFFATLLANYCEGS